MPISPTIKLVIIISVLAIIGGGVYWFIDRSYLYPELEEERNPVIETPTSGTYSDEKIEPQIDTSDWKTYRNEKYGFEVKYPSTRGVQIFVVDNPNNLSLQDLFNKQYQNCLKEENNYFGCPSPEDTIKWTKLSIAGRSALRSGKRFMPEGPETDSIYITMPSYYLNIDNYATENQDFINTASQILSTFRSIESRIDTSDWKTYRNEKYGFEFKYPSDIGFYDKTSSYLFEEPRLLLLLRSDDGINIPGEFTIALYENATGLNIPEWVNENHPGYYHADTIVDSFDVCNLAGRKFLSIKGAKIGIYFLRGTIIYSIVWHRYTEERDASIFNNVILNFKCF